MMTLLMNTVTSVFIVTEEKSFYQQKLYNYRRSGYLCEAYNYMLFMLCVQTAHN